MDLNKVTPAIFCKNEEYWIHYVLRDLLKVFDKVVMLDTGSQDATKIIARNTDNTTGGKLVLIEEDFGDDPHKIGNSPNILRETVNTYWMLLLAGDEILRWKQLINLKDVELSSHKHKVGMIRGINLADVDGELRIRDEFTADKFFDPTIKWVTTEYPFEGYNQHLLAEQGLLGYLPRNEFYYWHVRCCKRSSLDDKTYFRAIKADYYPYDGPYTELPQGWLGDIAKYDNPYLVRKCGDNSGNTLQE